MKISNNKGISLIVLVITIIVIIILAGAVILSISGKNPISSAKEAVFRSDISNYDDQLKIYIASQYSYEIGNYDITTLNAEGNDVKNYIPALKDSDVGRFSIVEGELAYCGDNIEEAIISYEKNLTIKTTTDLTIDGDLYSYYNPIIPAGFIPIDTDTSKWDNAKEDYNKGLVIKDSYGNEFVWVPVDGINVKYETWCNLGIPYFVATDVTPSDFDATKITNKYGGFYIARYESVFDYNGGNIRVASRKSSNVDKTFYWTQNNMDEEHTGYLWSWINYADAQKYSEQMDESYGYTTVGTCLVTGTQWDTMLKWLQNSGYNVDTDTSAWSNQGNIENTGSNKKYMANNIYDIAGNTTEFIGELFTYDNVSHFSRGGMFTPAYRNIPGNSAVMPTLSFRVALYIK